MQDLMVLYQAIMNAKFESVPESLQCPDLSRLGNQIVDHILAEARRDSNEALLQTLSEWRQLRPHYPQFARIKAYSEQLSHWPELRRDEQEAQLRLMASPLEIDLACMQAFFE